MNNEPKKPSLILSIIPIFALMFCLLYGILVLECDPQVPLLTVAFGTAVIGMVVLGYKWEVIEEGISQTIKTSLPALLILIIVGGVISTWISSGVVPAMIYYGLKIINPSFFLVTTMIMCSIVSLAIGSSWTTAATVGIAMMGVGIAMSIPIPVIAGAVISGSYFGDKMSPMSDTTNLAPAVAGCTLFQHIGHMIFTVTPSYIISLALYWFINAGYMSDADTSAATFELTNAITTNFHITPVLFIAPLLLIVMIGLKVPAILALFASSILGGVLGGIYQGIDLASTVDILHYGYSTESGNALLDELLNRGGLDSMMWTCSLVFCAMCFAGTMETCGMLETITNSMKSFVKSVGSLIATTIASCFVFNCIAGDQYMAIIVPGRMYADVYKEMGLHPKNLSRCLEDCGTLTSPLIPWNSCGAFMIATLGLEPWTYVPYCFLNIINPIVSIIYGYTGFTIAKLDPAEMAPAADTPSENPDSKIKTEI